MLKVNAECKARVRRLLQFFAEVSKSRHSSLVLIGAPAQRYHSPLVLARTKCWGPSASEGPQKHDLTMFSK
jgi:hypothetical protein